MRTSFVISDTHFSHTNSWEKFKLPDGSPLRPFSSNEEMDEAMVERWNAVVKPSDYVYHLGDVAIAKRGLELVRRLNGHKRLIMGNHDIYPNKLYHDVGFEKVSGVRVFVDKYVLSHIPLHPDCVTDRFKVNVHGHLHSNRVMISREVNMGYGYETISEPDTRYMCVCVEQTNFTPVSFEELDVKIAKLWEETGYSPPAKKAWGNGSPG